MLGQPLAEYLHGGLGSHFHGAFATVPTIVHESKANAVAAEAYGGAIALGLLSNAANPERHFQANAVEHYESSRPTCKNSLHIRRLATRNQGVGLKDLTIKQSPLKAWAKRPNARIEIKK